MSTFTETIAALRMSGDSEEEDIAVVLEAIDEQHRPAKAGVCGGCDQPWPCAEIDRGRYLSVLWIGRAADRAYARALSRAESRRPA